MQDETDDTRFIELAADKLTSHFGHQAWVTFSYRPRGRLDEMLNGKPKRGSYVCIVEAECMGPLDRTTVLLIARNGSDMREQREGIFFQAAALATRGMPVLSALHKHEFNGRNQMQDAFSEVLPQFGSQIAVRRSPLEPKDILSLKDWDYALEISSFGTRPLRTWRIERNADVELKPNLA